jgi:hypothetical protein
VGFSSRIRLGALTVAALTVCIATLPAAAEPTQVTILLRGSHPVDQAFHQGSFTAPPPLCPSGTWIGNGSGGRTFTCADGSGTFSALFDGNLEHVQGTSGAWQIVSGTGSLATLRGGGTGHVDSSTGTSSPTVVFSDTWTGVVDLDATPPTGSIKVVKLSRPRIPSRLWKAVVTVTAQDNVVDNPVSFDVSATAGNYSAERKGTLTAGSKSLTFSFHRGKRVHALQIALHLQDPLGNMRSFNKSVTLR